MRAFELAECIARDATCAQGEFNQRVLAIIPYLTGPLDEIERLRAENARWQDTVRELADDLESEVEGRYAQIKYHPAMRPRYERDMDSVKRARLYLESRPLEQYGRGPTSEGAKLAAEINETRKLPHT